MDDFEFDSVDDFDSDFEDNSLDESDDMYEDTSDNFDDFEEDSLDDTENNEDSSVDENEAERKKSKRVAIMAVVAGLVVLVLCFGVGRIAKNKRIADSNKSSVVSTEQKSNKVSKDTDSKKVVEEKKQVNTSDNKGSSQGSWVEIEYDNELKFKGPVYGDFTVVSIKSYGKLINENGDKIIKTIAKGNISGLVGYYEIDIPYNKAGSIPVGTVLKVSYNIVDKESGYIIDNLKAE